MRINIKKWIISLLLFGFVGYRVCAQTLSLLQIKEKKKINLGLGFGLEYNTLSIDKSPQFYNTEEVLQINPKPAIGFIAQFFININIHAHWAVRVALPHFNYAEYSMEYKIKKDENLESSVYSFDYYKLATPIDILFKSDEIFTNRGDNFKFYISGGVYTAYNFTNNTDAKKVNFLKLSKYDYGVSTGFGIIANGTLSIFQIEFKYLYSLSNLFIKDPNFIFSSAIDNLTSHNLIIILNLY